MYETVVLGMGNNLDYELRWDSGTFEKLIEQYQITAAELSTEIEIHRERDLIISILAFLKTQQGGERFVFDCSVIEQFSSHFEKEITLGGTSVRAALAMHKLGKTSFLHLVTMNDDVRRLLPDGCRYVCSAKEERAYPHLIIQYPAETKILAGDIQITTHHANRLIFGNDADNMEMRLNPKLKDYLANANIFLISGFNTMRDEQKLRDRLTVLTDILSGLPEQAVVFYEDACFYHKEFRTLVRQYLKGRIDLHSLNEDELQEYLGRQLDLLNAEQMSEALDEMMTILEVPALVVHTKYWALVYGKNAAKMHAALLGGITMATTRFRLGDDFTAEEYRDTALLKPQAAGKAFSKEIRHKLKDKVCCLPSFAVEETKATTIGLGDAFVGGFIEALSREHQ